MNSLFSLSRQRDYDRYLCALFAKGNAQSDLMTLIAFNAELSTISEIVSEDMIGTIRLAWWRDAIEEIYSDKNTREHEVVKALEATIQTHDLPKSLFDKLIETRALDMEIKQGFETYADFINYIKGTVGTLHQLFALTLNKDKATSQQETIEQQAIHYGIVGHLRAIPFHAEQGIIHWPKDMMQTFGINPAAVTNNEAVLRLRAFINHWLAQLPKAAALPDSLKPLNKMHKLSSIYARKLAKLDGNIAELPPRLATMPIRLWCS